MITRPAAYYFEEALYNLKGAWDGLSVTEQQEYCKYEYLIEEIAEKYH